MYKLIIKNKKGTEFHTYKLKQERNFRCAKNIHPSTDIEEIKSAIETI